MTHLIYAGNILPQSLLCWVNLKLLNIRKPPTHIPVSYTHLDVYKRQEVKERVYLIYGLEIPYLEDFHKEGISGNASAGGEDRSHRADSKAQKFKGVRNCRHGNIGGDADDLDLEFPLLRQGVGVVRDTTISQ